MQIRDPVFAYATNTVFNATTHYVTIFMRVDVEPVSLRDSYFDLSEGTSCTRLGTLGATAQEREARVALSPVAWRL